jgi:hypothetical protein
VIAKTSQSVFNSVMDAKPRTHAVPLFNVTEGESESTQRILHVGCQPLRDYPSTNIRTGIQIPMAIIIKFSVNDTNPSGTVLEPPTQAHFSSRRSM